MFEVGGVYFGFAKIEVRVPAQPPQPVRVPPPQPVRVPPPRPALQPPPPPPQQPQQPQPQRRVEAGMEIHIFIPLMGNITYCSTKETRRIGIFFAKTKKRCVFFSARGSLFLWMTGSHPMVDLKRWGFLVFYGIFWGSHQVLRCHFFAGKVRVLRQLHVLALLRCGSGDVDGPEFFEESSSGF